LTATIGSTIQEKGVVSVSPPQQLQWSSS